MHDKNNIKTLDAPTSIPYVAPNKDYYRFAIEDCHLSEYVRSKSQLRRRRSQNNLAVIKTKYINSLSKARPPISLKKHLHIATDSRAPNVDFFHQV